MTKCLHEDWSGGRRSHAGTCNRPLACCNHNNERAQRARHDSHGPGNGQGNVNGDVGHHAQLVVQRRAGVAQEAAEQGSDWPLRTDLVQT